MKLCGAAVKINDDVSIMCGRSISNRVIGLVCGAFQLAVAAVSLAQHVYSILEYKVVFSCKFNMTVRQEDPAREFLAHDIIIYDYGLFGFILGTTECIANYLDGGYMRCIWCTVHSVSLTIMIVSMVKHCYKYRPLWPALAMQSIYSLGLVVLALAVLPKLVYAVVNSMSVRFVGLVSLYFGGTALNWFFTVTLWHYYWYLENLEKLGKQRRLTLDSDENSEGMRNDRQETTV